MEEVRIAVRAKPGASRTRVGGSYGDEHALVVAVHAQPVDGAANDAVIAAVAKALEVRRIDIRVMSGHTARNKVLALSLSAADVVRVHSLVQELLSS